MKGNFLSIYIFFSPSECRFLNSCISAKYFPILTINGKLIYSAFRWCIHLNFKKMYMYDWFWGPGSHIINMIKTLLKKLLYTIYYVPSVIWLLVRKRPLSIIKKNPCRLWYAFFFFCEIFNKVSLYCYQNCYHVSNISFAELKQHLLNIYWTEAT